MNILVKIKLKKTLINTFSTGENRYKVELYQSEIDYLTQYANAFSNSIECNIFINKENSTYSEISNTYWSNTLFIDLERIKQKDIESLFN